MEQLITDLLKYHFIFYRHSFALVHVFTNLGKWTFTEAEDLTGTTGVFSRCFSNRQFCNIVFVQKPLTL